jgi:hypothetical protein
VGPLCPGRVPWRTRCRPPSQFMFAERVNVMGRAWAIPCRRVPSGATGRGLQMMRAVLCWTVPLTVGAVERIHERPGVRESRPGLVR